MNFFAFNVTKVTNAKESKAYSYEPYDFIIFLLLFNFSMLEKYEITPSNLIFKIFFIDFGFIFSGT